MNTIKNIDHASSIRQGAVAAAVTVDDRNVVTALREIAQLLHKAVDRKPDSPNVIVQQGEIKVPLPQFVNEIEVHPTPIEIHPTKVENRIEIPPTQITLDAPSITFDVNKLVIAVYALTGVLSLGFLGVIIAAFALAH